MQIYLYFIIIALALFLLAQLFTSGMKRGLLIAICRALWILPFILALFPEQIVLKTPKSASLRPFHVFIDDSSSVNNLKATDGNRLSGHVEMIKNEITKQCLNLGCEAQFESMSKNEPMVSKGFSTIVKSVSNWLGNISDDPWLVVSDGGNYQPNQAWENSVDTNVVKGKKGAVLALADETKENIWVKKVETPYFAFEGKSTEVKVFLERRSEELSQERVQVQIVKDGKILSSAADVVFGENEKQIEVRLFLKSLPRGIHQLRVVSLPTPKEKHIWDNHKYVQIEVLPNTVGVLHLLGSPSWDGRFLRRYLKSEPKYDLISFYILRDPRDSNFVSERELSLIPFPVDRLFSEELNSFKILIIQNFALHQFLKPEYQQNLVNFVKNGGALFFIGGPRSLSLSDVQNSPLREIFPYDPSELAANSSETSAAPNKLASNRLFSFDFSKPSFNDESGFKIKFSELDSQKRALVHLYDDWLEVQPQLATIQSLVGLNQFTKQKDSFESTPLLLAESENGENFPLAVSSYPGKGRALWLFTDSIWKIVMSSEVSAPRRVYDKFVHSAMTWLLRKELKKPVAIDFAEVTHWQEDQINWKAKVSGPILRYLNKAGNWRFSVCNVIVDKDDIAITDSNVKNWYLQGSLDLSTKPGDSCMFAIETEVDNLGQDSAMRSSVIPLSLTDREVGALPHKMADLAELTKAKLITNAAVPSMLRDLGEWMKSQFSSSQVFDSLETKKAWNHYWFFETYWIWLLLLFMPLEVTLRRRILI